MQRFNIAKALTTLGDDVNLISLLGKDDEAERILNRLHKDGIRVEGISQNLKNTPISTVLFDSTGKRQIYCDLKDIQEQTIQPEIALVDLNNCDIAVLCNINFNRELIKKAKQLVVPTATDVHVLSDINDEYNRDFMKNADILFLSDEKLPCNAENFIWQIENRYHNKIIVIGMGAKGAMLLDKASLQRAVVFAGVKIGHNGASVGFCTEQDIDEIMKGFDIVECTSCNR